MKTVPVHVLATVQHKSVLMQSGQVHWLPVTEALPLHRKKLVKILKPKDVPAEAERPEKSSTPAKAKRPYYRRKDLVATPVSVTEPETPAPVDMPAVPDEPPAPATPTDEPA